VKYNLEISHELCLKVRIMDSKLDKFTYIRY